jgi:hypothetical protein
MTSATVAPTATTADHGPAGPAPMLPLGFTAATASAAIKKPGRQDMALLRCPAGATLAAVYTTNLVCAAPVQLSRRHLKESRGHCGALLINSGCANAATGERGMANAIELADAVARACDISSVAVQENSTGVIGVQLPVERMLPEIAPMAERAAHGSLEPFARAIMTTDTYPKWSSRTVEQARQGGTGGAKIGREALQLGDFGFADKAARAQWTPDLAGTGQGVFGRSAQNVIHGALNFGLDCFAPGQGARRRLRRRSGRFMAPGGCAVAHGDLGGDAFGDLLAGLLARSGFFQGAVRGGGELVERREADAGGQISNGWKFGGKLEQIVGGGALPTELLFDPGQKLTVGQLLLHRGQLAPDHHHTFHGALFVALDGACAGHDGGAVFFGNLRVVIAQG